MSSGKCQATLNHNGDFFLVAWFAAANDVTLKILASAVPFRECAGLRAAKKVRLLENNLCEHAGTTFPRHLKNLYSIASSAAVPQAKTNKLGEIDRARSIQNNLPIHRDWNSAACYAAGQTE